ncbi:hypothetical protein JCM19275_3494 [Nonlabens ulvanivorans]|uniref:HNH domain-containing protein n=1 Tax=Nonlabens ulvanivorans TaxID=906888 RepID=A0A090WGW9_NONUL|nr:hypothetical protein [Nonlabens ulvanivorans]GAL74639.1 hypothetical protein JCM19275_3494 [Nonlabens ulvanivorans]
MIYLGEKSSSLSWYQNIATKWLKDRFEREERKGSIVKKQFKKLFTDDVIKELVRLKPEELIELEKKICDQYKDGDEDKVEEFISQAKSVFVMGGYRNWFLSNHINYDLATRLDTHTCTYCNREYTFVFKNKLGGKGMVPQFDHWYAKKDHPLLALSFFNLIPSCATCNTIKKDIAMSTLQHLHPYINKNISKSYVFNLWLKEIGVPEIGLDPTRVENEIESKKNKTTLDALNLGLIYKGHSTKELKDLYDLRIKYPENYLKKLLDETFGNLDITINEKYRLIFGIELEDKDYHKRIMSKFKSDIIKKLINL